MLPLTVESKLFGHFLTSLISSLMSYFIPIAYANYNIMLPKQEAKECTLWKKGKCADSNCAFRHTSRRNMSKNMDAAQEMLFRCTGQTFRDRNPQLFD